MATNKPIKQRLEAAKAFFDGCWDAVMPAATTDALKYLRESKKKAPPRLLHFTDVGGAVGILRGRNLRLARSRSSNDPMELKYGLDLVRECLLKMPKGDEWAYVFKEEVRNCLDGRPFFGQRKEFPDPHICCFSLMSAEKSIPQWALYGRRGSGLALVFSGKELAKKPKVDLVKVVYSRAHQIALIKRTLAIGIKACAEGGAQARARRGNQYAVDKIYRTLAHAFGSLVTMHAAVMKRPEFRFEQEWRLIVSYLDVPAEEPQLKFDVWASGSIMKTFFECPIASEDLKGVIVGPTEADLNEPALRMVLDDLKYDKRTKIRVGSSALRR